ncbi:MAG: BolA/IbaG family iron-sulfur metabolism protein [Pseudomonadales bacterium]|nr:BolA/IbaG family iron-sulfur metabolism protein [Gammaproteobacteria bacterium]NNL57119.1 BolA/IbaG family iron-sulfur metabolism protein [Pseudomonadales bacterium]
MQNELEKLIRDHLRADVLDVELSGNHCNILVVSEDFAGLTPVKRQQKVYHCLADKITSGEIHAVNIKALTPEQWQASAAST